MNQSEQPISFLQYRSGGWAPIDARIIAETPVALTVNGQVWLTFMCTPNDLPALAAGFLFNEGLIQSADEIASVDVCPTGDNVDVWTRRLIEKPALWRRTSGCTGGGTSADLDSAPRAQPSDGLVLAPERICALLEQLYSAQELYRQVRGVHSSALSDGERIVIKAEDIGRHNTLDKIAGRMLLERVEIEHKVLVTTGRVSSEMLQKAVRIGAYVLISRTSPSSLSVRLADELGITLIGYARRDQFNVYAHPSRVATAPIPLPLRTSTLAAD